MALLAKLKALIKARERSMQKRRILENDQEELYKLAEIRISEHVEADVVVRIGGVSIGIAETLPGAVFRQVEGKIETRDLDDLPGELA
jgi:molybdopterin biosynthesis enzyme